MDEPRPEQEPVPAKDDNPGRGVRSAPAPHTSGMEPLSLAASRAGTAEALDTAAAVPLQLSRNTRPGLQQRLEAPAPFKATDDTQSAANLSRSLQNLEIVPKNGPDGFCQSMPRAEADQRRINVVGGEVRLSRTKQAYPGRFKVIHGEASLSKPKQACPNATQTDPRRFKVIHGETTLSEPKQAHSTAIQGYPGQLEVIHGEASLTWTNISLSRTTQAYPP